MLTYSLANFHGQPHAPRNLNWCFGHAWVFLASFFVSGQHDLLLAFQYILLIFSLVPSSFWVLLPVKSHT